MNSTRSDLYSFVDSAMPFQLGLCLARKPISSDSMGEERRFVERLRSKLADWSYLGRAFWGLWGSTSSCQLLGVLFESRVFSRFCSSVWVLVGDGVFSNLYVGLRRCVRNTQPRARLVQRDACSLMTMKSMTGAVLASFTKSHAKLVFRGSALPCFGNFEFGC